MTNTTRTDPAFPTLEQHGFNQGMPGMTLRDYFAAKALLTVGWSAQPYALLLHVAHDCYAMADAMLKARDDIVS